MRRYLSIFAGGGLLGILFGIALGIFLFPYLFPPPPAAEQLSAADRAGRVLARGSFIHANPSDPVHWGRGSVELRADSVFLGSDFEVGPGPKFHVYLVTGPRLRSSADLKGRNFVDLGRLRSFAGSQRYAIPAGIDAAAYPSVVIWCEQFGVLISPADLMALAPPS